MGTPRVSNIYQPYNPFNSALDNISDNNTKINTQKDTLLQNGTNNSINNSLNKNTIIDKNSSSTNINNNGCYLPPQTNILTSNSPLGHSKTESQWWSPIVPYILPIVETSRHVRNAELELRLGTIHATDFKTGVSKWWFDFHLNNMLGSIRHNVWANTPEWSEMEEYIFRDGTRCRRERKTGECTFIKKASIRHYDIPLEDSRYHIRLMLKTESPAPPVCGKEEWVRLKERISFAYKNVVVYDFTLVKEGASLEEAKNAEIQYEMEIECVNVLLDPDYIAKSLLMKCTDLLVSPKNPEPIPYVIPTNTNINNTNQLNYQQDYHGKRRHDNNQHYGNQSYNQPAHYNHNNNYNPNNGYHNHNNSNNNYNPNNNRYNNRNNGYNNNGYRQNRNNYNGNNGSNNNYHKQRRDQPAKQLTEEEEMEQKIKMYQDIPYEEPQIQYQPVITNTHQQPQHPVLPHQPIPVLYANTLIEGSLHTQQQQVQNQQERVPSTDPNMLQNIDTLYKQFFGNTQNSTPIEQPVIVNTPPKVNRPVNRNVLATKSMRSLVSPK